MWNFGGLFKNKKSKQSNMFFLRHCKFILVTLSMPEKTHLKLQHHFRDLLKVHLDQKIKKIQHIAPKKLQICYSMYFGHT